MTRGAELLVQRGAVVGGGTGGIGRAIARLLAARGAEATVVGQTFRDPEVERLTFVKADLSLMREAQRVGGELARSPFDLVVLTTGVMAAKQRETTAEGIERLWEISDHLLNNPPEVQFYAQGTWGPGTIRELIAPHTWRLPFERRWREVSAAGATESA